MNLDENLTVTIPAGERDMQALPLTVWKRVVVPS